MIHRRTMLEEPNVAPDGTLCYFLSSTTLADFDVAATLADLAGSSWYEGWLNEDGSEFQGTVTRWWECSEQLHAISGVDKRPGDNLILWPTDEEFDEYERPTRIYERNLAAIQRDVRDLYGDARVIVVDV